jgi:hypothetical protein
VGLGEGKGHNNGGHERSLRARNGKEVDDAGRVLHMVRGKRDRRGLTAAEVVWPSDSDVKQVAHAHTHTHTYALLRTHT